MDKPPKVDRFLLWLFERRIGESSFRANARVALVVLAGIVAVLGTLYAVRFLSSLAR
jgi:hypothetical protein